MRVLQRPVAGDARPAGCALVLLAFSAVFTATAVPALPGVGAVLYLVIGVAGVLLCAVGLVAMAGRFLTHRPVLEIDDHGVRLPAPWPWPRAHDRALRWADLAAVVVWSRPVPRGRRGVVERLAFLPVRAEGSPSPELLALGLDDVPGVATGRWAVTVSPGWDPGVDDVLAEVRRRELPAADLR